MKNTMLIKVLIAIVLAIVAGLETGDKAEIFGVTFLQIYSLIGQLFLNALQLVVVPLVASSIITGTARMGSDQSFGTLGLKTFSYFILTVFLAILTGLTMAVLIAPGTLQDSLPALTSVSGLEQAQGNAFQKLEETFFKIVPSNILLAASQGQMLGLIFFCMLFGFFIPKIESQAASVIMGFWNGIFQIMMRITQLFMKALPIGVFGLVAKAMATTGLETIETVAYFFVTVLGGLLVYAFLILPLLLRFAANINPLAHFKAMVPALITAFSTSSSAATLPVTIDCVEKKVGVSNRISSFILPLGASINLSGSSLYVCVSVLFIAQSYGVQLSIPSLILVAVMTQLTSLGTAGIPSASMFSVMVILQTLGLPADSIGLIMSVERILDMFRTPVNVFGTSCCAVWAAASEGEKNLTVAFPPKPVLSE